MADEQQQLIGGAQGRTREFAFEHLQDAAAVRVDFDSASARQQLAALGADGLIVEHARTPKQQAAGRQVGESAGIRVAHRANQVVDLARVLLPVDSPVLGAATAKAAARIREFNPDASWKAIDDRS